MSKRKNQLLSQVSRPIRNSKCCKSDEDDLFELASWVNSTSNMCEVSSQPSILKVSVRNKLKSNYYIFLRVNSGSGGTHIQNPFPYCILLEGRSSNNVKEFEFEIKKSPTSSSPDDYLTVELYYVLTHEDCAREYRIRKSGVRVEPEIELI